MVGKESSSVLSNAIILACSTYGFVFFLFLCKDDWDFSRYGGLFATGFLWVASAGRLLARLLRAR